MSKHIRIKGLILSSALSLALIGCTSSGEDTSSQGRDVSFGYELTSAYSGQNLNRSVITNRALEIFTGELLVTNVDTRDEETHPWSAYINEDDFSVTSNKTIVLKPGNYEFTLTLSKGNSQYVSETVYEIKDSDQVNIPFELKPVLGSLITNVDVVDEIPSFKFKYQLDEISSYDEPRIGITIDNGAQKFFNINKATGLSDAYVNIPSGEHNVSLDFYDGNIYLGKSQNYPTQLNIVPKEDININLVALHGEATLGFTPGTNDLNFVVNIPSQIVTEVKELDNLETVVRYTGKDLTGEKIVSVTPNGAEFQGNTTISNVKYGDFAFSLEFQDKTDGNEVVGSCSVSTQLSEDNTTVNCEVILKQRANGSGNLLATVGVNVFNENMEPVEGAKVFVNDDMVGITGSGTFGTKGYLKRFVKKGEHNLSAEKDSMKVLQTVQIKPLDVKNFDLKLDQNLSQCQGGHGDDNPSTESAIAQHSGFTSSTGTLTQSSAYDLEEDFHQIWRSFTDAYEIDGWNAYIDKPTISDPDWFKYEFNTPIVINKIGWKRRGYEVSTNTPALPKDFTIIGIDKEGNEKILKIVINAPDNTPDDYIWFTFSNSTAYKAYKITITSNNNDTTSKHETTIGKIKFIEAQKNSGCQNNGNGSFTRKLLSANHNTYGIAIGDLNNDGLKDIYVAELNAKDYVLMN